MAAPVSMLASSEAVAATAEETAIRMLARRRAATVVPASIARPVTAQTEERPVLLRRDLANQVGSPTGGYGECEVTVAADGSLRVYAPSGGGGGGGGLEFGAVKRLAYLRL